MKLSSMLREGGGKGERAHLFGLGVGTWEVKELMANGPI